MRIGFVVKIAFALIGLAALASMALVLHWHLGARSAVALAGALLLATLLSAAFISLTWLGETRAKAIVQRWATEHGYTILRFEHPFPTGAFSFWTTSRGQSVYSVTIRDGGGSERRAWVRCGSFWGGVLLGNEIEVKWSDDPKAA